MNTKHDQSDYDTIEGIEKSFSSYQSFTKMLNDRQNAGYNLHKSLNRFLILGKYELDSCGNIGTIEDIRKFPELKPVLKWKEFQEILKNNGFDNQFFIHYDNSIPPFNMRCTVCNKSWEINTCHDSIKRIEKIKEKISKESICKIGNIVKKIKLRFKTFNDGIFRLEDYITNEKYIDKTPKENSKHPKNELGILNINDNYKFQENDTYFITVTRFYHKNCLLEKTICECNTHLNNNGKNYQMKNLAGIFECDPYIELELKLANINIHKKQIDSEVPTTIYGKLENGFTFQRAWYYWIVNGLVPINLAIKLYKNNLGKKDIRVAGHCGRPSPLEFGTIETSKGKFIASYHIDSWQGLKLFTNTIKHLRKTK